MKYRKLRTAWSVVRGVVAELLCVLWVRSYRTGDILLTRITNTNLLNLFDATFTITLATIPTGFTFPYGLRQIVREHFPPREASWHIGTKQKPYSALYLTI